MQYIRKKMESMYKVLIVNAPLEESSPSANYSLFPSLGIISLATRLKNDHPEVDVKVIDGGIYSAKEILRIIDSYKPGIVAMSVLTPTYSSALKIAEYSKNNYGSTVILGNDHASLNPELILKKREFVDYVIKSEFGEPLLSHLIGYIIGKESKLLSEGQGKEGIFYRERREIKRTYMIPQSFNQVYRSAKDIPNLKLIEDCFLKYINNYNQAYKKYHNSKKIPVTINTARGCKNWRDRCIYCGIYNLKPQWSSADFFWEVIRRYNEEYGVNFFFEVADEFLTFRKYIKEIIQDKLFDLKGKNIEMEIYTRSDDILTYKFAEIAKELNIVRVNMGLDSGDNRILKLLGKNLRLDSLNPTEINYNAVKLLAENGIQIHASFVLGGLGETKESLKNTLRFIERISKEFGKYIVTLEASELVPIPGSHAYNILVGKLREKDKKIIGEELLIGDSIFESLKRKYIDKDIINIEEISQDWIKYFTKVSWEDIKKIKKEIKDIANDIDAIYGVNIGT